MRRLDLFLGLCVLTILLQAGWYAVQETKKAYIKQSNIVFLKTGLDKIMDLKQHAAPTHQQVALLEQKLALAERDIKVVEMVQYRT